MNAFIMFHGQRCRKETATGDVCYCDSFNHNQDPYIFAKRFIHTYCKINLLPCSQMNQGDVIFWFTTDNSREGKWFCDLVFVLDEIKYWEPLEGVQSNSNDYKNDYKLSDINSKAYIADEMEREDHFEWAGKDHRKTKAKSHRRKSLFADPEKSFQPLDDQNRLICMDSIELDLSDVKPTKSGYPKKILTEEECEKILEHINKEATKKLYGTKLKEMRTKLN